jgi:hypothetical protein
MNVGLRRAHAVMHAGVSTVLLSILVSGAIARPGAPRTDALPRPLAEQAGPAPDIVWAADDLWGGWAIVTRWRQDRARSGELRLAGSTDPVLELVLDAPLRRPEVLLYWSPTPPSDPEALPDTAHLLGAVGGVGARRFGLPAAARSGGGHLLLYSLGHDGVFAAATLPGGGGR